MPVFTARESDLRAVLDREPTLDSTTRSALLSKLPAIREVNVKLNEQLAKLIANPTQFADKTAFAAAWNSAIDNALSQLSSHFHPPATGTAIPEAFRIHWMQRVYVQECLAISSAKIEGWRDQLFFLCAFEASMTKLIVELTDKWNGFIAGKNALTDPETQAISIVTKALENSITDSRKISQSLVTYGENVKSAVSKSRLEFYKNIASTIADKAHIGRITDAAVIALTTYFGGAAAAIVAASAVMVKEGIKVASSSIIENGKQLNAASDQFRDWTVKAGYPIGMFKKNRELVANYRLEADLKKLDLANTAAQAALNNRRDYLAKCQCPPSMMTDCDAFAVEMTKAFKLVHDRCVKLDADFRAKFQGVFDGAASETTIEQLTGAKMLTGLVADTVQRVDHREPNREALKLLPAAQTIFLEATNVATDASGLPEEVKVVMLSESAEFKRKLTAYFEDLKRGIDEYEAYTRKLMELREEALKKLDRKALAESVKSS